MLSNESYYKEIVQKLEYSLDARQSVDRNANLGILVDAWTAKLERAVLESLLRRCLHISRLPHTWALNVGGLQVA